MKNKGKQIEHIDRSRENITLTFAAEIFLKLQYNYSNYPLGVN